MHLRLDLLGGLAGDMFIAALLDAFPEHADGVLHSIAQATGGAVECRLLSFTDGVLQGRRFDVVVAGADRSASTAAAAAPSLLHGPQSAQHAGKGGAHAHDGAVHRHVHQQAAAHRHDHQRDGHTPWRQIRAALSDCGLGAGVLRHAVAIFERLAVAEARVHGVAIDDVEFHEVGAWDSIADIVGAAHLIDALGDARWAVGAVPLGSGRVRTSHGPLPVPAPAAAVLLEGFAIVDDGIAGERVTPTGAAILAHLCDPAAVGPAQQQQQRLRKSGIGFGTRRLPGISNCARVLVLAPHGDAAPAGNHRQLAVIEFEVDDQSAEDLAMGLDHLRSQAGVFDVVQAPVFGKKGRMMTAVRALAAPSAVDDAIAACFRETTTIGLRHHLVAGAALQRSQHAVQHGEGTLRVKVVQRPGGPTAKAESDDVRSHPGHAVRRDLRMQAERLAIDTAAATGAVDPDGTKVLSE